MLARVDTQKHAPAADLAEQIADLVDHARKQAGHHALRHDPKLHAIAAARAHAILAHGGVGNEGAFITHLMQQAHAHHGAEAVAFGAGPQGTPAALVKSWLAHPAQRQILMSNAYTRIGVGVVQGAYQGQPGAHVAAASFTDG
jgi:uncharacterized protein YkwD